MKAFSRTWRPQRPNAKGVCSDCGAKVQVMADGFLARHFDPTVKPAAWCDQVVRGPALTEPARRMLDEITKRTKADGWARWDDVYPHWDIYTAAPALIGNAARKVVQALVARGLVELGDGGKLRKVVR